MRRRALAVWRRRCRHFCKDSSDCADNQRCRFTAFVNDCSEIEGCTLQPNGSCECTGTADCTAPDVCVDAALYPTSLDCPTSQATCSDLDELSGRLDELFLGDASAEKLQALAACRAAVHEQRLNRACAEAP